MIGKHNDKALGPSGTKLSPAAQAVLDLRIAKLTVTDEETREINRLADLATERWNDARLRHSPYSEELRALAAPSAEEQQELAAATAARMAASEALEKSRRTLTVTQEMVHRAETQPVAGYGRISDRERRALADAQAEHAAAFRRFEALRVDYQVSCEREARIAGEIDRAGGARQRQFMLLRAGVVPTRAEP